MHIASCDTAGYRGSASPRLYRLVTLVTLVSFLFGGLTLLAPTGAEAAESATTTDYLNLRTGPGTTYPIIAVMPTGASVSVTGAAENGFYPVSYGGNNGYASGDYLSIGGSAPSVSTDGATGTARVIDGALNLRSGPGMGYSIITVMPDSAIVTLTGEYAGGFLGVVYNGTSGYAYADYLSQDAPSATTPTTPTGPSDVPTGDTVVDTAVTTSVLNLRGGPSTSHGILAVMPSGAAVNILGAAQGGFYPVSWNGTSGWASGDYLSIGSTAPALPADPAGGDIVSIIYAAAAAYGQDGDAMLRVARCESVLDPNAYNASSGASGLFQFLPGTWATTPYAGQDIFDPVANANAAAWMWSVGRRGEWVCQ